MITEKEAEEIFMRIALEKKTYKDLSQKFGVHYTTLCKWMKEYKTTFKLTEKDRYCARTFLKYKYRDEIIQKYSDGASTKKIALSYGLEDDSLIAQLLRDFKVDVRATGVLSKTDQNMFKTVTTEIEAYTVGLLMADGSISPSYEVRIELHENDRYLLESINNLLCSGSGKMGQTKGRTTVRLSFCGKQICNNLKRYNVVHNKTYLATSIFIFEDPVLMQHYIRGLFDGDGICSKSCQYLRLGYCAHVKSFTESYQTFMCETLNLRKNKLFDTGGSWNCSWGSKENIEKIYNYLYKDATIYLDRKKNKIKNYLYGNTEVTN